MVEALMEKHPKLQRNQFVVHAELHLPAFGLELRCDPNHQRKGPWNDWVMVMTQSQNNDTMRMLCRLLGFVKGDGKSTVLCVGQLHRQPRRALAQNKRHLVEQWVAASVKKGKERVPDVIVFEPHSMKKAGVCFFVPKQQSLLGEDTILHLKDHTHDWPLHFISGKWNIGASDNAKHKKDSH